MDDGKKISFGFSKSIKKNILKSTVSVVPKKVDYIECLDEKAIKVVGKEEKEEKPLIIPMLGSRTWHDRIVNKTDANIFEPKIEPKEDNADFTIQIKQEPIDSMPNGHNLIVNNDTLIKIKEEPKENNDKPVTLEEQAAKEILEDLKSVDKKETKQNDLTLPLTDTESLRGKEESTLQDYEEIPVDVFGVAMLRGMGWKPGQGIGKNEKVVAAVIPELRPKGMGLGADKLAVKNQKIIAQQQEDLKIKKGAHVKIIAGKHNHNYGIIEGLDDDSGRLIVKLALGGNVISLNEFTVQPVTRVEYEKNSKVLNSVKYEKFKDKVCSSEKISDASSEENEHENQKQKSRKKFIVSEEQRKKHRRSRSRDKKYDHLDSENNSNKYTGKRKSSSSSSSERIVKSSKKSKKHKRTSNSPEEKNRKRDKSKKKHKDRKNDRVSPGRRKHKKNKKSRSRSRSRSRSPRRR